MRFKTLFLFLAFPLFALAQKHGHKQSQTVQRDTTGNAHIADSLLLIGMDYAQRGIDFKDDSAMEMALDYYQEALLFDTTVCDTWNNIGTIYSELNDDRKAIYYFSKAVRIKPHYPSGWYNIAVSYYKLEISDSVFINAKAAIGVDSSYLRAYQIIGLEYYKLGKKKQAVDWFNKATKVDPKNVFNWSTLAQYNFEVGDTTGSVEAEAHWAELEPYDPAKWDKLAMFYKVHHNEQKYLYYTKRADEARRSRNHDIGH